MSLHFRIIETEAELPDVLIHIGVTEEGNRFVNIKAIGVVDGVDDYIEEESIQIDNMDTAIRFIRDFRIESANEFCLERNMTYS